MQPPPQPPKPESMGGTGDPVSTCPTLWVFQLRNPKDPSSLAYKPCTVHSMKFTVDCHIATAFVTCEMLCSVPLEPKAKSPAVFQMPISPLGTVTELYVQNTSKQTVFVTAVVPADDSKHFKGGKAPQDGTAAMQQKTPDPEVFQVKCVGQRCNPPACCWQ